MGYLILPGGPVLRAIFDMIVISFFLNPHAGIPDDMKRSLMVFLPKKISEHEVGEGVYREPAITRPLSMTNTDAKLFSASMAILITKKVARHCLIQPPQKCFRGRDMLANAMEAESFLLEHHLRDRYSSGLVLTDFESAFPSIKISWVLKVLGSMGAPKAIILFFFALYQNNSAIVYVFGKCLGPSRLVEVSDKAIRARCSYLYWPWSLFLRG